LFIELDTHFHSVASTHGYSTVKEIAQSAAEKGLKGFALTDHGPASPDSPHVWHFRNLQVIPDYICGVRVIKGAEVNIIDYEGNIDMSDFDLKFVDWVVASYHAPVIEPAEDCTEGYIKAIINNPCIDVIGHPGSRGFYFDTEKLVKTCKEYNKFIEINESAIMHKKDMDRISYDLLNACKKHSVSVVVNSDGHYCDLVGDVSNSEKLITELEFPVSLIANACAETIYEHIAKKRAGFNK